MAESGKRKGFSIVELLVGMIAGAILALTAGTIIFYGYLAWRRNSDAVDLQRDGTAAMQMLSRRLREASASDVTVLPERITIQTTNAPISFYRDNNDLEYDPDTGSAGDEVTIIAGRVATFAPTNLTVGVSIVLELQAGEEEMRITSMTGFRN